MTNILIPAMGKSMFFKDYYFPKLMIEINGETVLEKVIKNYDILEDKHFIFILSEKECSEFHIDDAAKLLTNNNCTIIQLKNETAGGLCTSLMAIEYINNDNPLIITNFDQIISVDYNEVLSYFENSFDAGVITFYNIHPRWSYARIEDDQVVEVAEKRPISKSAIAGFYYYKKGCDFVEAAKSSILKDNAINHQFYISSSLNEMILKNKKIGYYEIAKMDYHSFYSPDKIKQYEMEISKK